MIRATVAEYPARPFFRCALAQLYAGLGQEDNARRELDDLAKDGFASVPFDIEWLYGMSLLAETCALLSDGDAAAELYGLLLPYAGFNAADVPEGIRGSVSRYLGLLASTMSRFEEARRHFEDAMEMNERMGARPWLAHSQEDYGRMLLERGETERASALIATAIAIYRELGMEGPLSRAASVVRS